MTLLLSSASNHHPNWKVLSIIFPLFDPIISTWLVMAFSTIAATVSHLSSPSSFLNWCTEPVIARSETRHPPVSSTAFRTAPFFLALWVCCTYVSALSHSWDRFWAPSQSNRSTARNGWVHFLAARLCMRSPADKNWVTCCSGWASLDQNLFVISFL